MFKRIWGEKHHQKRERFFSRYFCLFSLLLFLRNHPPANRVPHPFRPSSFSICIPHETFFFLSLFSKKRKISVRRKREGAFSLLRFPPVKEGGCESNEKTKKAKKKNAPDFASEAFSLLLIYFSVPDAFRLSDGKFRLNRGIPLQFPSCLLFSNEKKKKKRPPR